MSVRVMSWVWDHSTAGGTDRLVLLAIADAADDSGCNAWPSVATLARKARIDQRTVQRVIRRLEAGGHLKVVESAGGRWSNRYVVVMEPSPQAGHDPRGAGSMPGVPGHVADPAVEPSGPGVQPGPVARAERGQPPADCHPRQDATPPPAQRRPSPGTAPGHPRHSCATRTSSTRPGTIRSSASARLTAYVSEVTGADDEEADALIQKIKTMAAGGLRKGLAAYVRSIPRDDLADHLDELRATTATRHAVDVRSATQAPAAWRAEDPARPVIGKTPPAEFAAISRRGADQVRAALAARTGRTAGAGATLPAVQP